jgi:hypothetical protein
MDPATNDRRADKPAENDLTFDADQTWRTDVVDPDATWPNAGRRPTREEPFDWQRRAG